MAGEWETLPVAEAPLDIIDGDRGVNYPKQEDFAPAGDCLFLNTGNVTTTGFSFSDRSFITKEKDALLRKGKLQRHDVVLTTRGTVGNVALFDETVPFESIRINSGMVLLRADRSKLLPRFLYQFVRSPIFKEQVAALSTGSAQPQLPIRDIRRIELPVPPSPTKKPSRRCLGRWTTRST
jgi:type I restriction enzyme S subunit